MKNAALGYREGCTCMWCLPETTRRAKLPTPKLRICKGKFYKDRVGRVYGPMEPYNNRHQPEFDFIAGNLLWDRYGRFWPKDKSDDRDLVAVATPLVTLMDGSVTQVSEELYDALQKHSVRKNR